MEQSILKSTKKILGLAEEYDAFDLDVITFINAAFSTLDQAGIGPLGGFVIEDDTAVWADFVVADSQLQMVKTYIYLKVRLQFDPPSTSYQIESAEKQLEEYLVRLNTAREYANGT